MFLKYKNVAACVPEKLWCKSSRSGGPRSLDLLGAQPSLWAGLFVHEQVRASTLCEIRKSRAVTRGMWSFPLLLSAALRQVCLYVCERERRNQRDGCEREQKTSLSADTKGQISLRVANSFRKTRGQLLLVLPVRPQRAVYCHPTRGHMTRISCLTHASIGKLGSCSMSMTHDELCHHFRPESGQLCPLN